MSDAPERITYNPGYRVTYEADDPSRGYVYVRADTVLSDPRVTELVEAAKEVGRISDRDHVAWRRLAAALDQIKGA
jgi:hypothetical protein